MVGAPISPILSRPQTHSTPPGPKAPACFQEPAAPFLVRLESFETLRLGGGHFFRRWSRILARRASLIEASVQKQR
jgi:hypothetical protein